MKKKIQRGLLISILMFLIGVFSGAIGWPRQMLVVSVASVLSVYLAYRYVNPKFGPALVIAPFYLVYAPYSIYAHSYPTFPIWAWGFIMSAVTYFLLHFKSRAVYAISIISFLIWFGAMIVWPNNFSYITMLKSPERFDMSKAVLTDQEGNTISPEALKGKVVMLDIWHTACYSCIKQFPELQKLSDYYRNDTGVKIICLNVPLERDKEERSSRFTKPFSFLKYYFKDAGYYYAFSNTDIITPYKVILDKTSRCRFVSNGMLMNSWNIFIGNEKRIINQLKNEKS